MRLLFWYCAHHRCAQLNKNIIKSGLAPRFCVTRSGAWRSTGLLDQTWAQGTRVCTFREFTALPKFRTLRILMHLFSFKCANI